MIWIFQYWMKCRQDAHPSRPSGYPKEKEKDSYDFIHGEINKGRQVFIVYPLVEESAVLDLKAAVTEARKLQHDVFLPVR